MQCLKQTGTATSRRLGESGAVTCAAVRRAAWASSELWRAHLSEGGVDGEQLLVVRLLDVAHLARHAAQHVVHALPRITQAPL